jgi:hypothetical protein
VSCVPNVASFSVLSIIDCPFGILYRLFTTQTHKSQFQNENTYNTSNTN